MVFFDNKVNYTKSFLTGEYGDTIMAVWKVLPIISVLQMSAVIAAGKYESSISGSRTGCTNGAYSRLGLPEPRSGREKYTDF